MKRAMAILLCAVLLTIPALAQQTLFTRVEYEGYGRVEVDFSRDVMWQDPNVTVTNAEGDELQARIVKLDDDDLLFSVADIVEDQDYDFTITGIFGGEDVTGSFYADAQFSTPIDKVEYDGEDRELSVEFRQPVRLTQDSALTIVDAEGNEYAARIVESEPGELEAWVDDLAWGQTYTLILTDVLIGDDQEPQMLTRDFVARDS